MGEEEEGVGSGANVLLQHRAKAQAVVAWGELFQPVLLAHSL
jgi:hypothetical protein